MATSFWSKLKMATKAFRESFVTSSSIDAAEFEDFDARQLRYELLWSMYENTAYRNVHKWAQSVRNQYGLYKWIRNLYNPTYRLVEFWKMMVWGGPLDMENAERGGIPIKAENDALIDAIITLWGNSRWQINKSILVMNTACLGDGFIYIRDDPDREDVYMDLVHPSTIKELTLDKKGNVQGYVIEEGRVNDSGRAVVYKEVASRTPGSDDIQYATFMDGKPYPWNGIAATWSIPYGFVPMVALQHINVGKTFGWCEAHPARSRFMEVDDLSSKLHDHLRKMVDPVWLFSGMKKPEATPTTTTGTATVDRPMPGREELPALYGPAEASAKALVAELDIGATLETLRELLSELEREYPELQMDIWSVGQDTSGKALRVARQRAETKVIERRVNYDDALVRAHQMGIAIGGWRGYSGFDGFDLESYAAGDLDHRVAERSIFTNDPLDDVELKVQFWTAVNQAVGAGVPLEFVLRDLGLDDDKIQKLLYMSLPEETEEPEEDENAEEEDENEPAA